MIRLRLITITNIYFFTVLPFVSVQINDLHNFELYPGFTVKGSHKQKSKSQQHENRIPTVIIQSQICRAIFAWIKIHCNSQIVSQYHIYSNCKKKMEV